MYVLLFIKVVQWHDWCVVYTRKVNMCDSESCRKGCGYMLQIDSENDLSISRPFIAGFIHVYRHSHTWTITTGTALPLCIAS